MLALALARVLALIVRPRLDRVGGGTARTVLGKE